MDLGISGEHTFLESKVSLGTTHWARRQSLSSLYQAGRCWGASPAYSLARSTPLDCSAGDHGRFLNCGPNTEQGGVKL